MMSTLLLMLTLVSTGALVSGQPISFTLESTDPIITNNTEILITDIGEDAVGGNPRLTCNTDLAACCRDTETGVGGLGQWTYPDGSLLLNNKGSAAAGQQFYRLRNSPQAIKLGRRENAISITPTGSYCCTVPTDGGVEMTLCANLVLCPSLTLMDGVISYSDPTLGENTVATHTCEAGSALTTDLSTRTCGVTTSGVGVWSGSPLVCAGSACPDLTDLQNGAISYNTVSANGYRRVTTVATYSCTAIGFELTGGTSVRMCTDSGWDGTAPTCTATTTCPDLPVLNNVMIVYDMGTASLRPEGTVATYTCDTGYTGVTTTMTCGSEGTWSGSEPTCDIVTCPTLPNPDNGMVDVPSNNFMSNATYTCNTGYTGDTTRTCQANGMWSGSEPACDLTCEDLTLTNGMVEYSDTTTPRDEGSTATYSCTTAGFELTGSTSMRMCTDSGWDGIAPACTATCDDLLVPTNGVIIYSPDTIPRLEGAVATHSCDEGYGLMGGPNRTCEAERTWSGSVVTCQAVDCGPLTDAPSNGAVDISSGTTFGSNATYTCNTGYTLTGSNTRTCGSGGWSSSPPTCPIVDCGPLTDPTNGMVDAPTTTFESNATYTCVTGYTLTGDTTRMCGAGGSWTLMDPTCVAVDCSGLANPSNGAVNTSSGTTFMMTATYTCNTGYTLTGSNTRTCQDTMLWSGAEPTCNPPSITTTVTSSGPPMAGQNYTLTCTVTGAEALNPTITYEWTRGGTLVGGSNPVLTFNPLTLSNSGQYVCTVTVTSDLLTTTLTDASDTFEVTIKVPPPSVSLSPPPTGVFTGQSVVLSCTILLDSSVDTPVTVTVQWFNPTSTNIANTIATLQSPPLTYQSNTTLSVFMAGDVGTYNCATVVTSSRPLTTPSESVSAGADISLTPSPSDPVITVIAGTTSLTLTFSWTQPEGDIVSHYVIATSYVGDCPEIAAAFPGGSSSNFPDSTIDISTIATLQEYSNYSLNVSAVNDAGISESSTLVATTLSTPPSTSVQNLMATPTPSTVIVQWDRVACINRNSEIIGYRVTFGPTSTTSITTTDTVTGTDMRTFTASSLIPRTQYTFTVTPFSASADGRSAAVTIETTLPTEVMFQLGGQFYSSHSVLDPSTISTGSNSLLCVTNTMACCQSNQGQWYFPDGTEISTDAFDQHFISRGLSVVRLNRRSSVIPAGVYRCEVPASSGTESVYIGLYPPGQGTPTIPGGIQFSRAALTLTCVSNGGPASEVVWTRNGDTVSTGYTLTQTVTNTATATYENVLTATAIADLVGNFTCTVNNSRGTVTADIILNGVQILGDSLPFTVGSAATLSCVSDSDATMIEWLDGNGTRVVMTTTGRTLDYVLDPVRDDLHQTTFTCRVTRANGVGEQSITLSLIVPVGAISIATSVSGSATAGEMYSLICSISELISGLTGVPQAVWTDSDGNVMTGNDITVTSSDGMSTLTFNSLKLSDGDTYTCTGSLQSPPLSNPLTVVESRTVIVTIPTPGVTLTPPPPPLTAGTPLTLTCTITVDNAVDFDVVVDIVWDISTTDTTPITTTSTASGSVVDTLPIPILSTRYTGVTCRASVRRPSNDPRVITSSQGSASVAISVEVPPPPLVTISVSGDSVAGSSLSLLCTATPPILLVTPPTISWMGVVSSDDDVNVTNTSTVAESNIMVTFNPLRTSRGGVYVCVADYNIPDTDLPDLSNNASTIVNVLIPRPDTRITFDPMMDGYTVGLFLTLGCEVTLSSAVDTVVNLDPIWRREGVTLTTGDQLTVRDFPMTSDDQVYTSLLEFQPLTRDFIGNDTLYECETSVVPQSDTFITGTTTNTSTTLTVGVADFSASISSNSTVLAGSEHTLMCQGTRGDDQADGTTLEVEWFNPDGVLITGDTSGVMITGVTDITTDPTLISSLIFPSLQTSQAGPYTCRVNHTIPDTTITDQSILSSSVVTVQINTPQVMISASRSATLYEGTTGQILCCVVTPDNAGVNTPTSVTRDITGAANRDTTSDTVSDGVIIVEEAIQVLSLSDTGTYTCSATVDSEPNNMYIMSATTTDTLSITVEVLPVPVVEISPSSPLPVLAGSSLDLTCSVSVEDLLSVEPLIQWTLSDQPLSGVLNGRTNTLTFDPLLTTNATQYTCTATINIPAVDITSTGSNSTDLTVDIPPPTVSVSSPTPVYHGTNHTLSCNAGYDTSVVTTAVTLDYSWTGPNLIAFSDSAALTLSPVDLPAQSSGGYNCTVTVRPTNISAFINPATDSDTYTLDVLDAPPPEVLTGVPVREERCGQVSSITCTASVIDNFVATPTFMWRGPGGDIVDFDNTLNFPSVVTGGEYTCMACVNVPQVNITNLCTNSTITIQDTTPQPVSGVVCSSLSPSTLSVSWSPPTDPVLSYQVEVKQYSLEDSAVDTVSLSTLFDCEDIITNTTVDGLAASTRYLVSVEAVSGVGCSDVTEIDCYTEQTQPPVVTGVTVDRLNGTAMNVSWTPLNKAQSNGFIQSYIVTYSVVTATPNRKRQGSQQVTVSSDKSGTIIGGLDPGSEYSVGVSASGAGGTSESSPLMVSPTIAPTPTPTPNLGIIIGIVVVVLVLIVVITITIIVIVCLVKRHQARDKYRLKTDRNFELASMGPTTTIEPTTTTATAHHPLGGDELEHAESEKAKEALNGAEEVVAVATVTPAEVLDRLNPVSLTSFRSHVQNMHDDRAKGFEAEYQSFSMDPLEAHEEAKIPHNRLKNRFANIYPYDHSRVLLNAVPGVAGSEYINACWLEGYQRPKAYIAAQGPMPTSLDDFWRMIWEYKLANIVMLTRCKEGGRVKCEQYWAEDIGGVFETENKSVSVTTLSVTTYADFVIRQFTVKNNHQAGSEPLKVTQFHFTAWPDHGVPKFATSLISFIRKTQRVHNKESGVPLLVHCSAGVGRTGTFITLDAMLERIHSETSVNVYAFVKAMRKNRVLMVQTLAQYSFIHDALDELITCGETDIPAGALRTKVNLLSKVIPGKGITGFTNQFQLLEEVSRVPDPEDVNDANEHFNKDKNRYPDRVPYNMSRARLRPSGEDGSEYINASFIDGYKQRNAYIAAQGPLRNTVDDFWRMIWEFKSKTVAMVCNSEEGGQESAAPYWPPKEDEPVLYGKITVTLQAKAAYGDFTVRKFTIQEEKAANGKQMDGFTVTLFHHTEWPLDGRPKTGTLIEMLDMITKSQMSTGNRPITVMCNDGVGRTGTFICIHAQLERLKTEGVVDFFQSIKLARIQRAGLVPDVTNYAFCHEVLADFIDKFDNYANFKDMI